MTAQLLAPYGGRLVNLLIAAELEKEVHAHAATLPSLQISQRSACDLELLACGAFSPLDRFMGSADYAAVLESMRLAQGLLFPIPIILPAQPRRLTLDQEIALRDDHNRILAIMRVEEIYSWDRAHFAEAALGTQDVRHPLIAEMQRWGDVFISGPLRVFAPRHLDFVALRMTPAQTRAALMQRGSAEVVAFQTRNPLHRAHEELTKSAAERLNATLFLHPTVGLTQPGDIDAYTRVRSYITMYEHYYDQRRTLLALLPLAMRMAGPREALWHAIVRRNYGASHFIVGRDHAGPGQDSEGHPFYPALAAQQLVQRYSAELGMGIMAFDEFVYLPDQDRYAEQHDIAPERPMLRLSGTQLRQYLALGRPLPSWFTRPEVAALMLERYPARHRQGVCVWFTGLSGAGKSTTAEALTALLMECGRQVTLLDGDVVRTHLSQGLGFSKEDRDSNIRRIGFVAAEIVRHGGVVVCAAISPYRAIRAELRSMVGSDQFIEVFVDTPLEECERRDSKGMYAKARRGEISGFTGIDDPYEPPLTADILLDTLQNSADTNARAILHLLAARGFVRFLNSI